MGIPDHSQLAYLYLQSNGQIDKFCFYYTEKKRKWFLHNSYKTDIIFESLPFICWLTYKPCSVYHGCYRYLYFLVCLPIVKSRDCLICQLHMTNSFEASCNLNYVSKLRDFFYGHFIIYCIFYWNENLTCIFLLIESHV